MPFGLANADQFPFYLPSKRERERERERETRLKNIAAIRWTSKFLAKAPFVDSLKLQSAHYFKLSKVMSQERGSGG